MSASITACRLCSSTARPIQEILQCPDIDFITSPTSYSGRDLATGYPHAMSLVDSIKLHGKLWFDENDFRTFLAEGVPPRFPGYTDTFEKTVLSQRRSFAWTFTNRLGMWWFDMGGGWYDDPRMLAELETMNRIAHENLDVDGRSTAQIAFVVDDNSGAHLSTRNPYSFPALILQLQELGHVWASQQLLAVSVKEAGTRTIHLPKPHRIRNLWNGEVLAEKSDRVDADLGQHETLLLRLD